MTMRTELIEITPQVAEAMLRMNRRNRPLRRSVVQQYARDMQAGRWRLTHQGIAFDTDGILADGQHRLYAVIESGTTQLMAVTWDVPKDAQIAMDDHVKRETHDALTIQTGTEISKFNVAIARVIFAVCLNRSKPTKHEILDALRSMDEALEFVAQNHVRSKSNRGINSAAIWGGITLAWYHVEDEERLSQFCRILQGIELAKSDSDNAAVLLREWLLRTTITGGSAIRTEAFKKTQRAIKAFVNHEYLGRLHGPAVYYPWPQPSVNGGENSSSE